MTDKNLPAKLEEPMVVFEDGSATTLQEYVERHAVELAQDKPATVWTAADPESFRKALAQKGEVRKALMEWVWDNLVENIDYGRIHVVKNCKDAKSAAGCKDKTHYSKPSLWKAGAEKIVGMLELRATWPELVEQMRDAAKSETKHVVLRCVLLNSAGVEVSEGVGARSLDSEYYNVNKALKMAKKSSLIDAVLNAAGLSEVFSQDDDTGDVTEPDASINEAGQKLLHDKASELFGEKCEAVLESLARRRFHFADGDWKKIPAWRLQDAVRSIEDKAKEETKGGAE